jgi:transcriptional regulator with XRE-family HTH domain
MKRTTTFEQFEAELQDNPEYKKEERRIKPFYDLALEIIKRRISLKLTQKDLAEKANTYQSRISKIESSEFDVRLSTLISIADALDTQLSIKFIPIADSFYDKENLYQDLFKTNAIPQPKTSNIAPKLKSFPLHLEVEGTSKS